MSDEALRLWQRRLEHLRIEEASCSDASHRFAIGIEIEKIESKIKELSGATIVDSAQEKRIRDFVEIVGRALEEFEISLSQYAVESRTLEQMIQGQLPCTPQNLNVVRGGLWSLVEEKSSKTSGWQNLDDFWDRLLADLRQRLPRANTSTQWAELHKVLKLSLTYDKHIWETFWDGLVDSPYLVPLDEAATSALASYRRHIVKNFREINLSGFGGPGAQSEAEGKAELSEVYIDLDTVAEADPDARASRAGTVQRRSAPSPIPALERLAANPRLVLIGLPGSGKSTLLKYFSLSLAQCGLSPEPKWRDNLHLWPKEEVDLIPVFVELRHFAASVPTPPPDPNGGEHLTNYILGELNPTQVGECAEALEKALAAGRAIVFLDGLDEVPDDDRLRRFVLNTVQEFSGGRFGASRIVVTCRPRSYDDPHWQLKCFEKAELAGLSLEKTGRFIHRFYREVARRDPQVDEVIEGHRKAKLEQALRREELRELATNPFMLTVMAWLHRFEELPHKRALILNTLVEQLLFKWEERKRRDDTAEVHTFTELLQPQGLAISSLRGVLCRLAFQARQMSAPTTITGQPRVLAVSIPKLKLLAALQELVPPANMSEPHRARWALEVSQVIEERTGLLVPEGKDSFIMPYKLQEFLAGEHLTNKDELEEVGLGLHLPKNEWKFDAVVARLIGDNDYWDEVVKWAGAIQTHVKTNKSESRELALELCMAEAVSDTIRLRRAIIAQEILSEVGLTEVANSHRRYGPECLECVRKTLSDFMSRDGLNPKQRAAAGSARGWLEDLPRGVGLSTEGIPDIVWIDIGSGSFLMGNEASLEDARIKTSYQISRYPVTVAQFQAFVDDGGYEKETLWNWLPEASQWLQGMNTKWSQKNTKPGPEDYAPVFQTPNHPRVGVSWFEAVTYCKWLNAKLELEDDSIRLQSEPEWERAARGPEGRQWPSGNYTSELWRQCNVDQTKIEHTSAVGLFPAGDTPPESGNEHGVADLAGNVWEWCRTSWMDTYLKKEDKAIGDKLEAAAAMVARGGSWSFGHDTKYISPLRRGFGPGNRYNDVGFRMVRFGAVASRASKPRIEKSRLI